MGPVRPSKKTIFQGPKLGEPSISIGIDENGLGPRLGPMIVTGIVARTHGEGTRIANSRPKGRLAERLGDSKKLVSFGNAALGEAWARAIADRTGVGAGASGPDELLHSFAIESRDSLRAPCPTNHQDQCWNVQGERFEADDELRRRLSADLERLAGAGVEIVGVHVGIVCTKRLNDAALLGQSRFDVDLHTMERIVLAAHAESGGREVYATCGKVGGFGSYGPRFGPLSARAEMPPVCEGRARSEYRMAGVGTMAFVRDADDTHMLVCLASLVGKWVRECLMSRIVRYYQANNPKLPAASGYHDPVTTKFIDGSALARKKRGIEDACFERLSVGDALTSAGPVPRCADPRRGGLIRPLTPRAAAQMSLNLTAKAQPLGRRRATP